MAFGLSTTAPNLEDVTWDRVGAATMSLCLTLSLMVWLGVPARSGRRNHADREPGPVTHALEVWLILMVAVVLLLVQGFAINRLAGLPYPLWAPVRGS